MEIKTVLQLKKPQEPKPRLPLPKPIILPPRKSPLISRLLKKADEGLFEAVAFKFGKEVSIKKGTKQETTKALSKFLGKTLAASGFLKEIKTGRKLKAEETGLLLDFGFRKSKVSPFLVVEKKAKRLRRGGTGKIIQAFRKTSSKKKRKKNLFGL